MNFFRNTKVKIFLTVFLVYLFYIAPDYITANTNRYIDLTKAIVDDKTFNIDRYYKNTMDCSFYMGHYYVGAAPGLSLMAVPVYIVLKPLSNLMSETLYQDLEFNILNLFFIFFLSILPGALIAVLLYEILSEFNLKKKEKMLIIFTSSFGTLLFFYSTKFMAHTMGAFMLFSAFYILFRYKNSSEKKYLFFLAGVCLMIAILLDYILIIGSVLMIGYFLLNFKKDKISNFIFFASGLLLIALVYMYYHYKCFDNPFTGAFVHGTLYDSRPISLPQPKVIYELTVGTYRGIFMYMPTLLISIYGIYLFFRKPEKKYIKEMIFISLFSLLVFLLISGYDVWDAGEAFGQRYFICFIPFLMIPMAFAYKKINYRIIFWLTVTSIFINWCGVQYGDADSAFINVGLFIFRGLNSNLAEWTYKLTNAYIRKLNVITHFSPLMGLIVLFAFIYLIWKTELDKLAQGYFCKKL